MTQKTSNNPKQLVEAVDITDSVSKLEKYWGDISTSSAFSDASNVNHRYGWGQQAAEPPVAAGTPILAEEINRLRAQINTSHYHTDNTVSYIQSSFENKTGKSLVPEYSNADLIYISDLQRIDYQTETQLDQSRFNLGTASGERTLGYSTPVAVGGSSPDPTHFSGFESNGLTINNGGTLWDDTLYTEFKYTWESYTKARYFFNAGGKLIVDLTAVGGSDASDDWEAAFDQIDEVWICAENTIAQSGKTGTVMDGFYDLTGTYTTVFESKIGFNAAYGATAYIAYSSYAQYGGRRIRIEGKAEDTGSVFEVTLKVTLIEDFDDIQLVDSTITCDTGFILPIETPDNAYMQTASGDMHKAGIHEYQFKDRQYPSMTLLTAWTTSGVGVDNSAKVFTITPSTATVSTGAVTTFTIDETTATMGKGGVYIEIVSSIPSADLTIVDGGAYTDEDSESWLPSTEAASGLLQLTNNTGTFTVASASTGTYVVRISRGGFPGHSNHTVLVTSGTITVN